MRVMPGSRSASVIICHCLFDKLLVALFQANVFKVDDTNN